MRRIPRPGVIVALFVLLGPVMSWAQSPDVTDAFEVIDPSLTVTLLRQGPEPASCLIFPPPPLECGLRETLLGLSTDATGNVYHVASPNYFFGFGKYGAFLRRTDRSLGTVDLARVYSTWCYGDCASASSTFTVTYHSDVTNGRILALVRVRTCLQNPCTPDVKVGFVEIGGLPSMFDVLLTYVPQTSSLTLLTPAHPEGFNSADAFQVWEGDAATLPDWSQATPVACNAATDPVAGSMVSVADPRPSPAVGHASYYIVASQSGQERRLGRQALAGRLSAREAATLPACP